MEPLWAKPRKSACNRTTAASLRSSPGHPGFNKAKALHAAGIDLCSVKGLRIVEADGSAAEEPLKA